MSQYKIWGQSIIDPNAIEQMNLACAIPVAVGGALMADSHLGYSLPIGGVLALDNAVSPLAVGVDIACYDGETEVLSPSGWIKFKHYTNEPIMQYDPAGIDYNAKFVKPSCFIKKPAKEFIHFQTKYGVDLKVTPDHRQLVFTGRKKETQSETVANDIYETHYRTKSGYRGLFETTFNPYIETSVELNDDEVRLVVAVCADARMQNKNTGHCVMNLKKERKIKRIEQLLKNANVEYKKKDYGYVFYSPVKTKSLSYFWKASKKQLEIIVDEILNWDGYFGDNQKNNPYYCSRDKHSIDFASYAFAACGVRTVISEYIDTDNKITYRLLISQNTKVGISGSPKTEILKEKAQEGEFQYCVTVPSSWVVTRRNGRICISGNCRMKLSLFDVTKEYFESNRAKFRNALVRETVFGVGEERDGAQHNVMDEDWSVTAITASLKDKAKRQLGTSGSGNHFAEFGYVKDSEGNEFIGLLTHSGSRGAGASVCNEYSCRAQAQHGEYDLPWLDMDTEDGQEYWLAMNLMGKYAAANHDVIHSEIARVLGLEVHSQVENHHNFCWLETHNGKEVYVHRKGATPAGLGVMGIIPGSMGSSAFVVTGKGNAESLNSASHGAGRVLSRKKAKEKYNFKAVKNDLIKKGIDVISAGADEVPGVYKDIHEVMSFQNDLVNIIGEFSPKIVKMCRSGRAED